MPFVSKCRLAIAITLFSGFLLIPATVSAQGVNDFRFSDFTADYLLTNDDPQGTLEITETMELVFSGQNRGILRALPNSYKGNSLQLEILDVQRDGQPEPYITYTENDNTIVQIGNPSVFITGAHTYNFSYRVENVITFYDTHDELFWDVNGDEWLQPFDAVSAQLVHEAVIKGDTKARCFTGARGSSESNCDIIEDSTRTDILTTTQLQPNETLTFVQAFEKGYFTAPSWFEQYWPQLLGAPFALLQLGLARSAHNKWKLYGKDRSKRATAPFYGRPKNVSVMMANYVAENKLQPKVISAAIIDLAIRGYIQIVERKVRRRTKHDLVLKKTDYSELSREETTLMDALFTTKSVDATIELESKKAKLYPTYQKLAKYLDSAALENGFYDISPKQPFGRHVGKEIGFSLLFLAIGLALARITNGIGLVAGIAGFGLIATYAALMARRSQKGVDLAEHMDGLKLYLDMAEKDRINQQDAVEAPLSAHTGQPKRDVTFFEKLLPFAVAMGVEKSWSKAFADIYTQAPEWYAGNWGNGFTSATLAQNLTDATTVVSQSFSAPSSSSGSGFSGGGSAGGGGGGGGGGGW